MSASVYAALIAEARASSRHCDHHRYSCVEVGCDYDIIRRLTDVVEAAEREGDRLTVEKLEREITRLRALVEYVAESGVEFEDARLRYVTVQIDRKAWEQIRREYPIGGVPAGDNG